MFAASVSIDRVSNAESCSEAKCVKIKKEA